MKQMNLLLGLLVFFAGSTLLQGQSAVSLRRHMQKPASPASLLLPVLRQPAFTGLETLQPSVPPAATMLRSGLTEEIPGITPYDVQSNGTESARLHVWPGGEVTAAWLFSNQADGSGWPDRGTGYNKRSNWLNQIQPGSRLEANNLRTGYPNYVVTEDGTEFIVAHRSKPGGGFLLHTLRRAAGQSNWTEADIPTSVPKGELWSKAAVDGNTIHVLAITSPVGGATFGDVYRGVDGHVLYWRSKDAGATWDIVDGVIPGLDSTNFAQLSAEKYCIDARNGVVAVGIFDSWNDAAVFKSENGGDTWGDPTLIWDFPLDKYVTDKGYTVDDLGGADPNAPNELAIFTTDGSASILVDVLGLVHIWVGETYVQDDVLTDGGTSYYPGINGMIYWDELQPDSLYEITYARDYNSNDTLDFTGVIGYGTGLSSMPATASDDAGNLYLAYSAGVENLADFNSNNFRHIYTMKSPDLGRTWTEPVDVFYLAAAGADSIIADLSEGVWPMAYKQAQDKFHFIYQRDFAPGSSVLQADNQDGLSDIIYLADQDIVRTHTMAIPAIDFAVYPNPAGARTQIAFDLPEKAATSVALYDPTGKLLRSIPQAVLPAGRHVLNLELAGVPEGLYFVRLQSGNAAAVRKLVVR